MILDSCFQLKTKSPDQVKDFLGTPNGYAEVNDSIISFKYFLDGICIEDTSMNTDKCFAEIYFNTKNRKGKNNFNFPCE